MRPFLVLAGTEARMLVRRPAYRLLLGLFAALLVAAGLLSHARQAHEREQRAAYQRLVRSQWENQPDRHPHRVAHYGTFAFKPAGPLAAFDPGVDSYGGRIQFLEAHRQNAANFPEAGALSSAFRLGELSLAFVLQACLPLVLIVLGHRLLAGEAESGRLRLLLTQGVTSRQLAWGKAAGLALAAGPFFALSVGAAIAVPVAGGAWSGDLTARLGLLGLALAFYVMAWIGLTIGISAVARDSARALVILAAAWTAFCVVLPRAAGAWAAAADPGPSRSGFDARLAEEIHRLGDSHDPADPRFGRLRRQILHDYGVSRVEDLPVNYGALVMTHGEQLSAEVFARHFAELDRIYERQNVQVAATAWVNPALAFRLLSAALSGTDYRAHTQFLQEAEAYRYEFVQDLNVLHRDKIRYENDRDQRLDHTHWLDFPDFAPQPPSLGRALAAHGPTWGALALWAVLPFALLSLFRRPPL